MNEKKNVCCRCREKRWKSLSQSQQTRFEILCLRFHFQHRLRSTKLHDWSHRFQDISFAEWLIRSWWWIDHERYCSQSIVFHIRRWYMKHESAIISTFVHLISISWLLNYRQSCSFERLVSDSFLSSKSYF